MPLWVTVHYVDMFGQVHFLRKRLAALRARERSHTAMYSIGVLSQMSLRREPIAALGAQVRLYAHVHCSVMLLEGAQAETLQLAPRVRAQNTAG